MKARKSGQTGSAHGRSGLRIRGFLMVLSVFLVQHAAGAATTTWLEDNAAGISASGQGRFAEAQKLLESAKRKAEASGVEPQLLAFVKNNLAEVYANQGRYADAEYLFKEVLATRKKLLGRCNSDTATTINDLAFVYQTQGRYAEAEPLCKDAVEIYKKTRGDNDRNTNLTTCNLGLLYSRLGRFAEAETVFKETLSRQKNALGAEHQDAALTMENLASVYQREGRYPESERLYKEALAIQRKTFGAHPHTATTLVNLALLYSNQGKYAEAELFCKESLEMNKKLLGENHPSVATSMGILAGIYESKSRSTEAEQLLKQALSIRKRTLGHEHPETATHINNLAVCYVNHGRYAEAEPLLKEALAIKRNVLGDAHPDTAALQSNLATVYERMGRYAEAETVYKNALAIHDKALGPDQPESATIIYSLALLYEKQHRFSEAESSFRRSLRIRERHVNIRPQRLYLNRALDELCAVKGLLLISRPSARSSTVGGAQKLDQIVRKFDGCQNFPKINPLVLESASKEKLSQLPLIEVALFDHSLKNRNTDIVPLLLKARESQRKAGYSVLAAHTDLLIACRLEVLDGTNPDVIEQTTESLKSIAKAYLHHDAKTTRQRGNAVFSDDNLSRYESIFGSKKNCLEGMFRLLLCNAYLHEENRDSKKSLEIAELACSLLSSSNHIIPEAEIVSLRLAAAEFFRLTDRFSLAHKQLEDGMEVLARVKRSPDKQSGKAMDTASVLEAKLLLALTELSFQQADYQTAHDIGQRLRTLAVMNSTDHRQERVKLLASLSQAAINLGKAKEGLDYANEALNT
ncbi:MAG: tetratricopeptide repeat protein, partial [Cyanobacteria bacterium]|nr:tetratricopeptide repeat protein [Cyanobacteriota bacterium]